MTETRTWPGSGLRLLARATRSATGVGDPGCPEASSSADTTTINREASGRRKPSHPARGAPVRAETAVARGCAGAQSSAPKSARQVTASANAPETLVIVLHHSE